MVVVSIDGSSGIRVILVIVVVVLLLVIVYYVVLVFSRLASICQAVAEIDGCYTFGMLHGLELWCA